MLFYLILIIRTKHIKKFNIINQKYDADSVLILFQLLHKIIRQASAHTTSGKLGIQTFNE